MLAQEWGPHLESPREGLGAWSGWNPHLHLESPSEGSGGVVRAEPLKVAQGTSWL